MFFLNVLYQAHSKQVLFMFRQWMDLDSINALSSCCSAEKHSSWNFHVSGSILFTNNYKNKDLNFVYDDRFQKRLET